MAIARDAVSHFDFGSAPVAWSHTCASGSCLWVSFRDDPGKLTDITWAGYHMTRVEYAVMAGGAHHYLYAIDNIGNAGGPPSGTQTIAVIGTTAGAGAAESFSGFPGRMAIGAHGSTTSTGVSSITETLTTAFDNCWYVVLAADRSGTDPSAGGGGTSYSVQVTPGNGASISMGDSNGVVHPAGTISPTATVSAGGNSAILVAAFGVFPTPSAPISIYFNNVDLTSGITSETLRIDDVLNEQPNTLLLKTKPGFAAVPTLGMDVTLYLGSALKFGGIVTAVNQIYTGERLANVQYEVTAQDYLYLLNRRHPIGSYLNVSASAVVNDLLLRFATGFTTANVVSGLPNVTIAFDGTQEFGDCLSALATLAGCYWYVGDDKDLHFFVTEATGSPITIDSTNATAARARHLSYQTALDQIRTRVNVIGPTGASTTAPVSQGASVVPVTKAYPFTTPSGVGQALVKTAVGDVGENSPIDQSTILGYTGVQRGGFVFPPQAVSGLTLAFTSSTGSLTIGAVYSYAFTFVTAAGETGPSPLLTGTATGNTGSLSLNVNGYLYGSVAGGFTPPDPSITAINIYRTIANGSQLLFALSVTVGGGAWPVTVLDTVSDVALGALVPNAAFIGTPWAPVPQGAPGSSGMTQGTQYSWATTYVTAAGETLPSAISPVLATPASAPTGVTGANHTGGTNLTNGAAYSYKAMVLDSWGTISPVSSASSNFTSNGTNGVCTGTLPANLSGQVYIFRTKGNGSIYFLVGVVFIAGATSFSFTDPSPDTNLTAPITNYTSQQYTLYFLPLGPTGVTGRKVYRNTGPGTALKLLTTISDNTTRSYVDSMADGSLGATAPTTDTSGLGATSGIVCPQGASGSLISTGAAAGATVIPLSNVTAFDARGGYARIGSQLVQYAGVFFGNSGGNTVSGSLVLASGLLFPVPTSGTITATPALTGVTSTPAMASGLEVSIFAQVDDTTAQASLAALEGGDGIHEFWMDQSLVGTSAVTVPLATAVGLAQLALFKTPLPDLEYDSLDITSHSGKQITVNLGAPTNISVTLQIQQVTWTGFSSSPLVPSIHVRAAPVKFNLQNILHRMNVAV